jgi:hypothetical protein
MLNDVEHRVGEVALGRPQPGADRNRRGGTRELARGRGDLRLPVHMSAWARVGPCAGRPAPPHAVHRRSNSGRSTGCHAPVIRAVTVLRAAGWGGPAAKSGRSVPSLSLPHPPCAGCSTASRPSPPLADGGTSPGRPGGIAMRSARVARNVPESRSPSNRPDCLIPLPGPSVRRRSSPRTVTGALSRPRS